MHKFYGKIINVDEIDRIVTILDGPFKRQIYIQRAMFYTFYRFLEIGNFIVFNAKHNPKAKKKERTFILSDIDRIIQHTPRKAKLLYSYKEMVKETKNFINNLNYKLFLDLEMSMHPYHVDKSFKQEIIQAGYVLVDESDNVIETYNAFIKPTKHKKLTKRTLKFLNLTQEDVDSGIDYDEFHQHLNTIISKYNPGIIVWGRNDALALKETADINDLDAINEKGRFVNLLNLHKNIFKLSNDLSLINAMKLYGHETTKQQHDALDDAIMTQKIFNGFKRYLNTTRSDY